MNSQLSFMSRNSLLHANTGNIYSTHQSQCTLFSALVQGISVLARAMTSTTIMPAATPPTTAAFSLVFGAKIAAATAGVMTRNMDPNHARPALAVAIVRKVSSLRGSALTSRDTRCARLMKTASQTVTISSVDTSSGRGMQFHFNSKIMFFVKNDGQFEDCICFGCPYAFGGCCCSLFNFSANFTKVSV